MTRPRRPSTPRRTPSPHLTLARIHPTSPGLADGSPDPIATRILARSVAQLLWEWAQAGRPSPGSAADPVAPGRDDDHD
jgi:hypothetical protein